MPFAIMVRDLPGSGEARARLRQEHIDYLRERKSLLLAAGATLDAAGVPDGGLLIVDTEDRSVAERFAAADPFALGGVFGPAHIVPWRKAFFNHEPVLQEKTA